MTDFERKVYRILFNMTRFGKNPSMEQLKRKTGKDEQAIRAAVKSLMSKGELRDQKEEKWRSYLI
ncbi:hypothetical protein AXI59_15600 [Bacillus nakamurai]|uniref:MarR family transcriptional regulator n=1 Tax=Bacillus nakamurai TaxID=1793963 RepID=UPI0007786E39|nr:MarR family transcriptional regulator [Bacillus nakamurai]KXZ18959.1 hypothetical protein AXI59_15600 [Bacillus nakamurai]